MTTMIDRFFGIPQSVVRRGLVKELIPVALRLLVVLWHESEYHRTRKFVRTTRELMELVGCSRNSLSKASRIGPCQVGSHHIRGSGWIRISSMRS
jgi:hypothetical protein